ncbi:helix-turn-helix domain-containing protein [Mycolicibacterium iranicum]|uniref:ArsR family transcriptional regulator n=1 Tax=Mycolicibacterium iranicum TaxID=912594 RepID=A0A1X1WM99_MYCIR|nr:helix-turn-helix domain-containing protein [Mycolicibacterium iranicum]ORV87602.1 ArsR family transcriptional regulator [Mycolicibacterium iranicum]
MTTDISQDTVGRAARFAALADPVRLTIIDHLLLGDASSSELRSVLGIQSNLLAHHLGQLRKTGLIRKTRSEADGRRSYFSLNRQALDSLAPVAHRHAQRVVFVCTQNSARSQLAAAIWNRRSELPATSAGTHPAARVHPGTLAAARRHKLHLRPHVPRYLGDVLAAGDLVIAVCDNAHEELASELARLHWSVADPARTARADAFDAAVDELTERIQNLVPTLKSV